MLIHPPYEEFSVKLSSSEIALIVNALIQREFELRDLLDTPSSNKIFGELRLLHDGLIRKFNGVLDPIPYPAQ